VVSFEFTERLMESEDIERITMDEKLDDDEFTDLIEDAFLVIPATDDPAYNEHLSDIASRQGVLVNRVDDLGDVIIPSVIACGDIVIGISTLAHSPALSRYIRGRIEEVITPEYADMARLQSEVREYLKGKVPDQATRQQVLWAILEDGTVWEYLMTSYEQAFGQAMLHCEDVI
ncbi:MAG: bifunctional precorrin-2 dehydrogenase/sirohydrochlorin ferrochelatase, partial [Euryarchaeota archaeon]|nr:bifunctional precorrin-2 dehydrogenase/sirohydrochlorin ferrochelatase [Euryarchaeota archaeon]